MALPAQVSARVSRCAARGASATRPDADRRLDLANGIQSLPAHYRDVLLLRDIEELTIDEVAARLAASREAVKARLHRGRTLMREYLTR